MNKTSHYFNICKVRPAYQAEKNQYNRMVLISHLYEKVDIPYLRVIETTKGRYCATIIKYNFMPAGIGDLIIATRNVMEIFFDTDTDFLDIDLFKAWHSEDLKEKNVSCRVSTHSSTISKGMEAHKFLFELDMDLIHTDRNSLFLMMDDIDNQIAMSVIAAGLKQQFGI